MIIEKVDLFKMVSLTFYGGVMEVKEA